MVCRVQVRTIPNDEGNRLLRIVRRSSGSVVTWRRAQMVLLSAQGMDVGGIAKVTFTSPDRVRDVIHNFNAEGFDSLLPRYGGGRPPKFTLPQRQEIKKTALARPTDHGLPFSTWSLPKLADFLVDTGVVDDISHEGLRLLLREEGVSFQAVKTWKTSTDPDYEAKKNRVLELYAIADGKAEPAADDPTVIFCMDEFGPLNLQPHPGQAVGAGRGRARATRPRRAGGPAARPTSARTGYGTCSPATTCPATGSTGTSPRARAAPSSWRSAATCAQCTPPRCGSRSCWTTSARTCPPRPTIGSASGLRPTTSSSPTSPSTAAGSTASRRRSPRCATSPLDGTDHPAHAEQASMIRRHIAWRNRHAATHPRLREIVSKAETIKRAKVA
jgi:transposase